MKLMTKLSMTTLVASCGLASAAVADVKVGLIFSLSGPGAVLGEEMRNGVELAYEQLGGKLGGVDAELIYEDDQRKPDIGKQAAEKLVRSEKVDFVIGPSFSNVMMAVHRPVVRAKTILISPNPAPAPLAGEDCNPYYFAVPYQNDQPAEAAGTYMNDHGIKKVYLLAPNYQAGRDVMEGFKRTYKGEVLGEVYTSLEQTDFSAELTAMKAASPEAVFAFYPGGLGIQFVKQYDQSGAKLSTPLYTVYTLFNGAANEAVGDAGLGVYASTPWTYNLDNPANTQFVAAYQEKYGTLPSAFAAMAYDSLRLIDGSIAAAGSADDLKAVRNAMTSAPFQSVRGDFEFNTNNHPIESMYLGQVEKDENGQYVLSNQATIVEHMPDAYAGECKM
ncbi:ABC transporter substrate-binding protein [Celeribacter halophilus]|uniref:ABC transporter substrate-binding protein n=1 Tax=Celeribacter halophilus TaxID=576117 RepID=UPI001C08DAF5|nr:ABC transporter substrate-binding protein [Celeribacter halophilus]MBU2891388.1 ABC transporter substrate-binding protein [Celeribacter halophilus]MDO6512404.1 ABC transporter substrate-binding protein [Celeribacter halophilus]